MLQLPTDVVCIVWAPPSETNHIRIHRLEKTEEEDYTGMTFFSQMNFKY